MGKLLIEELQKAVENIEVEQNTDLWTDEEVAAFLEEHPMITVLLSEGFDFDEIMEAMDAGMMQLVEKGKGPGKGRDGNPGNDPFATAPLHGTSSAGIGGGKKNPRSRTGECSNCKCKKYVCKCTCKKKGGGTYTRTINMKGYYGSGRKAKYMDHWRVNHGPVHPR